MVIYGQVIIGPPGSGKSTYCEEMYKCLSESGRNVSIINLDPANDQLCYKPCIDINELITVDDVIEQFDLGPNGALVYSVKYLKQNVNWLVERVNKLDSDTYLLIDCPGQIELYTHYDFIKYIINALEKEGYRFCVIHLVDAHYCTDPGKYVSALLLSLCAMMQMGLPHVNVLSKIDLMLKHKDQLPFNPEYYTEVLNLSYLIDSLDENPFLARYKKLNESLISLVEDYGLVCFIPLDVHDKRKLTKVKNAADRANGFGLNTKGESQSVEQLLSTAMDLNESDYAISGDIKF